VRDDLDKVIVSLTVLRIQVIVSNDESNLEYEHITNLDDLFTYLIGSYFQASGAGPGCDHWQRYQMARDYATQTWWKWQA
jgi:hypothetical protein